MTHPSRALCGSPAPGGSRSVSASSTGRRLVMKHFIRRDLIVKAGTSPPYRCPLISLTGPRYYSGPNVSYEDADDAAITAVNAPSYHPTGLKVDCEYAPVRNHQRRGKSGGSPSSVASVVDRVNPSRTVAGDCCTRRTFESGVSCALSSYTWRVVRRVSVTFVLVVLGAVFWGRAGAWGDECA